MKFIFKAMGKYKGMIFLSMFLKLMGTMAELVLPYILEHMIDDVVPLKEMKPLVFWGLLMFVGALCAWVFNVSANRLAVRNAHFVTYDVRQELFEKTMNLSGKQFDSFGLPSLISRMSSDSYNIQMAAQQTQTMLVRSPMMLFGGLVMTIAMDIRLALILIVMMPFLLAIVLFVSSRAIPMFTKVQDKLDVVVRIMRENITGIRVIKALSKSEYEMDRFAGVNKDMADTDIKASTLMSLPFPVMQLFLNTGLVLVIIIGAKNVNAGLTQPGVITAFLTYFNMITMGVMGLNRIFMTFSRASASARRIEAIIKTPTDQKILSEDEALKPHGDEFIRFEHVNFRYNGEDEDSAYEHHLHFNGEERQNALTDIDFAIKKGESLGIIGPTGCGKTSVINLMMRFYDVSDGGVFVDGRDVRTYDKDELRHKFGVVFQNDMVFHESLRDNIDFGRGLSEEEIWSAIEDAQAADYIHGLEEGLDYEAAIKGANLSGGQKQRLMVARALAGHSEILVLDDSSSALDYKTDSSMRKAIAEHHGDSTLIMIAQRISSIMNMDHIMVLDSGRMIGYGTHEELLESCEAYKEIFKVQMGEAGL